jgi:hypothetical protein
MEPPLAPPAHGKGKCNKGVRDTTALSSISWQSVPQQTNRLVNFLIKHPADCAILFSSDSKKTAIHETDSCTSGSGKNEIHAIIAGVVFTDDAQYAGMYATNPSKF